VRDFGQAAALVVRGNLCSKKLEPAIGNIPETGIGLISRFSRETEKGFFYEGGALCHP